MSFLSLFMQATEQVTPFGLLTKLSGKLASAPLGGMTQLLIRSFIKSYHINLEECANQDLSSYKTFNDFFVRKLKPDARPIAENCAAILPCDGTIGQVGDILHGRLIQAKGIDYSLRALLGGDQRDCDHFESGGFCTIYLSPSNYHRVHMPLEGTLLKTIHIPGRHFPVGPRNISNLPSLYTDNERLVCLFGTEIGQFAVVFVAAALVGGIHTSWSGTIENRNKLKIDYYDPDQFHYQRGDEIGYFNYGSTVICLWGENAAELEEELGAGLGVQMGQEMLL
ncbi:MAG: archaetidylserine decarboxylase [Succinivibrio sp.]|nr:archaetidylserine decarboxylase [Succinivibrio sp.]